MPAGIRQKIGILLLVVFTGFSSFNTLGQNVRSYQKAPAVDPVTVHEERILALKPFLPASGEVGYITSIDNERIFAAEKTFSNVEFIGQFVLTQYTLAPLVVRNSPDFPFVVGNYITGGPVQEILEKYSLAVSRDLGDGLLIYRKGGKP